MTMSIALDPTICTKSSRHFVEVSCDDLTRGMTIVDELHVTSTEPYRDPKWGPREPNIEVCWEINIARWKEVLYKTLR